MTWYYFWEIAISEIFDHIFICFCMAIFYFLNKWDRRIVINKIISTLINKEKNDEKER